MDIPHTISYLEQFKDELLQRREAKQGKMPWYALHWARYRELYESPKIICRQTSDTIIASADFHNYCVLNSAIIIKPDEPIYSIFFWLAILNNQLIKRIYTLLSQEEDRVFAEVKPSNLRQLPIRRIHFTTEESLRKQLLDELQGLSQAVLTNTAGLALEASEQGWPRFDAASYRASELGQKLAQLLPQDADGNFVAFAEEASGAEEHSDVVHDLLAVLAEQMIELNKHKQTEVTRYLDQLAAELGIEPDKDGNTGIDSLANKTTLQHYLGDYQKGEPSKPWSEIEKVLQKNKKRFIHIKLLDTSTNPLLRNQYQQSIAKLEPIKQQLARTDALIDQIVYQLYGLSLAEIAVVEEA